MYLQLNFWSLTSDCRFFALLRRPNGKSDRNKTCNTFESLMKVYGYLFGIRFSSRTTIFEIIYTVAKCVTFWNEGSFCLDCACARSRRPIEMKSLEEFWQGAYLCMQVTTFDHQVLFAEPVAKM